MFERGSLISRTLALAILAAVPLIALQVAIVPYVERYRENRQAIEQAAQLAARYRLLAGQRAGLEAAVNRFGEEAEDLDTGYLEGSSDALAAAELQDLVDTTIETAGGLVVSVQTLPPSSGDRPDGPARTGLQVRFAASVDQLANALYALETEEPFLFVHQLDVKQTNQGRRKLDQGGSKIDIKLDVYGYSRPGGD